MTNRPTLIAFVGATAVGKTSVSIEVAQKWGCEIISADSRQCFAELGVGVAKPSASQLMAIPHHFISTHSITQNVDAAAFEAYALSVLERLFSHSQIALLVGGTGLYVKALCYGIDAMPAIPDHIRQTIRQLYQSEGIGAIHQLLQHHDSELLAQTSERQNPHRMMRALEFVMTTGTSIKHYQKGEAVQRPFRVISIGLDLPKETLHDNIDRRVDQMMADGLLEEAKRLLPHQHLNALQSVGYREMFDYLNGRCSLDAAIEFIKRSTKQYAKRQLTWFKKDTAIPWFSPSDKHGINAYLAKRLNEEA